MQKRRLLALPALPLHNSPLAVQLPLPQAILASNLASTAWRSSNDLLPEQQQHLAMYPSGTYVDFEHAPAGAVTWVQLLSGKLSLALVPPSERNLSTYLSWAGNAARWVACGGWCAEEGPCDPAVFVCSSLTGLYHPARPACMLLQPALPVLQQLWPPNASRSASPRTAPATSPPSPCPLPPAWPASFPPPHSHQHQPNLPPPSPRTPPQVRLLPARVLPRRDQSGALTRRGAAHHPGLGPRASCAH